jgi:hypothetical protein
VNPLKAVTVREIAIFVFLQKIHASMAINRSFTAEPELMYPETAALKSTRPPGSGPPRTGSCSWGGGSGDPAQYSTGYSYSGSALKRPLRVGGLQQQDAIQPAGQRVWERNECPKPENCGASPYRTTAKRQLMGSRLPLDDFG